MISEAHRKSLDTFFYIWYVCDKYGCQDVKDFVNYGLSEEFKRYNKDLLMQAARDYSNGRPCCIGGDKVVEFIERVFKKEKENAGN